mmetsp:Transcript_80916/g.152975  ORF Transcript_80916/g.152975 Transcript_80916/m.152975 type:complete len:408 (+) Transcript_80916:255-1478(+)
MWLSSFCRGRRSHAMWAVRPLTTQLHGDLISPIAKQPRNYLKKIQDCSVRVDPFLAWSPPMSYTTKASSDAKMDSRNFQDAMVCSWSSIMMSHVAKKDVKLATGHLTSKASFMYGSFDFVMRSHHPKDSCEQPETYAGFSCISLYTSEPVWNEIAVCFAKFAPQQEVHLTVYSGEKQGEHEKKFPVFGAYVTLDEPTNLNFHNYTVQRLPSGIAFWVDGVKKLDVDKSQCSQLPTEPMKMRVILRPYSDSIEGSATIVDIQSMEAQPLDDARANILAESIEKARDAEFEKMTDTETTQYLHVAPFKGEFDDWVQIKQDIFAALGLEYPGVGLLSRNPVKRASVVAHDTIIMLGDEAQAIKAQDFVNNATAKGRECYGKADCKSWQARAVTEAEYSMLGAAPIEYSES